MKNFNIFWWSVAFTAVLSVAISGFAFPAAADEAEGLGVVETAFT